MGLAKGIQAEVNFTILDNHSLGCGGVEQQFPLQQIRPNGLLQGGIRDFRPGR